jgi:hypothetical protein
MLDTRNFILADMIDAYDKDEPEEAYESYSDDEGAYHPALKRGKEKSLSKKQAFQADPPEPKRSRT